MVEVLVHLELQEDELPPSYTLLKVEAPASVAIEEISVPAKENWKADLSISKRLGDEWLRSANTALARVPSAILPNTFNYLLNPLHRDAKKIRISNATRAAFDPRLLRHLRGG
jgi:RES domain-containing protein